MVKSESTTRVVGREAPRYLLRLPIEVREALQKQANMNGRSVNSEIVHRLITSLDRQTEVEQKGYMAAEESPALAKHAAQTDSERMMLAMFKRWPPEKQLALLSLFK